MGRRGPAPEPTRLKLLKGERRPSRVNNDAPRPRDLLPSCPRDVTLAARKVWRRVMREFGATGVITHADRDAFRIYCEAVARYEESARLLASSGPLVRGARRGELVKNPLHQVVRDNADLVRLFARELGLTPAARTALVVRDDDTAEGDPLEAWERARRAG